MFYIELYHNKNKHKKKIMQQRIKQRDLKHMDLIPLRINRRCEMDWGQSQVPKENHCVLGQTPDICRAAEEFQP